MERQEYIRRLVAAFDAMDDRTRYVQLRLFERASETNPRTAAPAATTQARVVPFRRVANQ